MVKCLEERRSQRKFDDGVSSRSWEIKVESVCINNYGTDREIKAMFVVRYYTLHSEGMPKSSMCCCDLEEDHITLVTNKKQQRQLLVV